MSGTERKFLDIDALLNIPGLYEHRYKLLNAQPAFRWTAVCLHRPGLYDVLPGPVHAPAGRVDLLLTKIIIVKNENAISMTKILGYEDREIVSLYLLPTTMALIVSDAASGGLGALIMGEIWKAMFTGFSGWF